MKKSYPFQSKAQILALVQEDDPFMVECLQILYDKQTVGEKTTHSTVVRNSRGFMASHALVGTFLAEKSLLGEPLSTQETDQARAIVLRYGKQLALHFRQEAMTNDPSLAEVARLFSAV